MAPNSESGGNAEPLGVRRQIELPEVNTEADDLAPNADTRPETAADRPETGSATVDTGESRPEGATASSEKEEQHALATGVTVPGPPGGVQNDGLPPDRPNKPVLAAVAIGGAVVLAIPILLIGMGSHDGKKHRTAVAADRVLPGDGQQPPPGAFVSTSPTTTPTPSASASKKGKAKASKNATPTPSAKPSASSRVRSRSVSNERPSSSAPRSLVLHAPHDIYPGHTVRTSRIAMTMQSGGNLVLRDKSNKIIWSTGTHRRGVYAEFQTDGNLVLYSGDRQAVWAAGSFGHDKSTMVFQSDYNVVIIDHGGHPVWATGTNR